MNEPAVKMEEQIINLFQEAETEVYEGWVLKTLGSRLIVFPLYNAVSYTHLDVYKRQEAEERTIQMLNIYADFCEQVLAMPVIKGRKTDKEKFAGAELTRGSGRCCGSPGPGSGGRRGSPSIPCIRLRHPNWASASRRRSR